MWSRSRSASAWRSHERGRAPEAHRRRAGCLARGPRDPRRHTAQRLHRRVLSRDRRRQGRADRVRRRARGYGRAAHDGARRDGQGPRSRLHRPPRPPRPRHDPLGARALRPAPRDDERLRRHAPAPGAGRRARVPPRRRRAHGGAPQVLLDDPASRAVPHGGRGAPLPLPRPREGPRASPRGGDRPGHGRAGVAPVDAYRMATLNPATYFGLDGDLGGIAPGRYADVCLLDDLAEPRPAAVVARGRLVASRGRLLARVAELPWSRIFTSPEARLTVGWRARAADFALPARDRYPVIRLVSAVITRLEERPLGPGDLRAALLDRGGRWVAPGIVAGFADRLDGLAATISTDFNIVALGRSPEAMARAVNRLLELHGGVVVVDGADVAYELPLPLGGVMTRGSVEEAADREEELRAALVARGYPHHEPLFTLFFLSADFLPAVRLTPRGVWDVKQSRLLLPSRRLSPGPRAPRQPRVA